LERRRADTAAAAEIGDTASSAAARPRSGAMGYRRYDGFGLKLIVCGVWECNATHNEMSNQEAAFSAVVPFGCFWWRRQFSKDHGPTCSSYRKP
jgi:hypothetical protein